MRNIILCVLLALASCSAPPPQKPTPAPTSVEPERPVANIPQWIEMCDTQPDSPACFCLTHKDDMQCQH